MLRPTYIIMLLILGAAMGISMRLPKLSDKALVDSPVTTSSDSHSSRTQMAAINGGGRGSEAASGSTIQSRLPAQNSAAVAPGLGSRPPKELPEPKVVRDAVGRIMTYRAVRTHEGLVGIQILPGAEAEALRGTGFSAGDLLIAVNGIAIERNADSDQVMWSLLGTSGNTATVARNGSKLEIVVTHAP